MKMSIKEKSNIWIGRQLEDLELMKELQLIQSDESKLEDCFYKDLEFGTGGLRGVIGVGTNRMNIYTVAKVSQGYSNYLKANCTHPSVAITYDSRINSEKFARTAAEVFAANEIRVHITRELMPTPFLSYSIRHLKCSGGIVITASHNPAKYNGYKVYGSDGCQITNQAAKGIMEEINKVDIFEGVNKLSFEAGIETSLISYIEEETVDAYIDAVSHQSLFGSADIKKTLSIVYSPLNGAGLKCVTKCLKKNGFVNLSVVAEQKQPDGNFTTCPYPNPEIPEALELGLRDAKKLGSDLLLATDPDCDRVGIAVRSSGQYSLLSGNEVGILMLDYICKRRIELNRLPKNPLLIKTVVTMDMASRIAETYGVQTIDVLTGFKFIGEQIGLLEKNEQENRFILGFEESYGYLTGSYVRDKDAVDASLIICEMAEYYKAHGLTLVDVLQGLYDQYGYCLNTLHSYTFEGEAGCGRMEEIMLKLREENPEEWCGYKVQSVSDFKESVIRFADGSKKRINLPKSNVLKYALEGNISLVVRPSGTEPKIKVYFSVSSDSRETAEKLEKMMVKEVETGLGL